MLIAYRLYRAMQTDDRACRLKTELLSSGTFRVLVGVTGSVAALKLPLLVSELLQLPGVSCYGCLHFKSALSQVALVFAHAIRTLTLAVLTIAARGSSDILKYNCQPL